MQWLWDGASIWFMAPLKQLNIKVVTTSGDFFFLRILIASLFGWLVSMSRSSTASEHNNCFVRWWSWFLHVPFQLSAVFCACPCPLCSLWIYLSLVWWSCICSPCAATSSALAASWSMDTLLLRHICFLTLLWALLFISSHLSHSQIKGPGLQHPLLDSFLSSKRLLIA